MIYITGDKHANFKSVQSFCEKEKTNINDILIILGDAGINYFANERDNKLKNSLSKYPITFFCIHGNHEERPENISTYKTKTFHEGTVYYEEDYPNILFAKDGEVYNFNEKKVLVIGGAYSIDKEYRILFGYRWYSSEQPDYEIKMRVMKALRKNNNRVDIILTHTCPFKYLPRESFIPGVDQAKVDNETEIFLDKVEKITDYDKWYCGHFHIDKEVDKILFMYEEIKRFDNL